jgi:hypothetical protein
MKKIEIEFERGGRFVVELNEKDAPQTCKTLWANLPLTLEMSHCMSSGHCVVGAINEKAFQEIKLENGTVTSIEPGTVVFFSSEVTFGLPEFCITYGPFVPTQIKLLRHPPTNVFAKIEEIEDLTTVCKRIHQKGTEKAVIRKKE